MKRIPLILALLASALMTLAAQNNPYDIDDECYTLFRKTELLVGREGFTAANEELLHEAIAKSDDKAQVLYYVNRLKNYTNSIPYDTPTTDEYDAVVLRAQEDLKKVADQKGFPQYFYYSYELVQNYFYNHGKTVRTMELVNEMQEIANQRGDEYGIWSGYRYLEALYVAQNDYVSARKYILETLRLYEKSTDPTVRKQSVCRLYCDLADCYPIGNDSVVININKAVRASQLHADTLRCEYHLARIAAFYRETEEYKQHRDYCLKDSLLRTISSTATLLFEVIDGIVLDGVFTEETIRKVSEQSRVREIKYIANIAESFGFKDEAFTLEKLLVARHERLMAGNSELKLSELEARIGNYALHAELDTKEHQMNRINRIVMMLVTIILLALFAFLFIHMASLRNHNRKLQEANEKVIRADEAKTRFVQNMSHELRTPLNAIVGFSQLLALPDGSLSPEEKDEFSGHIVNNTSMLTMLLDDILNVSTMDAGTYRISYGDGDLHFICKAAISSSEHRLQPGVELSYEPESGEPFHFETDPNRVQQILINMLTNACKHTAKGKIVLRTSLKDNPGFVTFTVTDTGTGIPDDKAESIFDRFTKLNEFVQGTGLGLPICRDIATRMGGKIWLDTTYKEGGARFVLTIPVNPHQENKA